MWTLYQAAVLVALGLASPLALTPKGRTYVRTVSRRLGRDLPPAGERPVWIHAVSVGEVGIAKTLVEHLPDLPVVVTTVTPTGRDTAQTLLGDRAVVAYLPLDLAGPVRRFLDHFQPRVAVVVEGDYWPLLLSRARRAGCPVVVVNGRVGDANARRLRKARWASRLLMGSVDRFGLRTDADRERLITAGLEPERLTVTGDLKFDLRAPEPLHELQRRLEAVADGRPLLVAGSTRDGEERLILESFRALEEAALLVVAPRHPERWKAVRTELDRSGLDWAARSDGWPDGQAPDVVLLDSIGELADCYRYAHSAFIGGTLVSTGGHNPLEAAQYGTPIVVGPSMENFREIAAAFTKARAWAQVSNPAALSALWRTWLRDPAEARAVGARGRELVERNRGATDRTLALLEPFLPTPGTT